MITRIELVNFMSHERTVIEPAAGLTVLVGPNNCGKSAVVAALQILCHNVDSTYVKRHGAKECAVRLETDDGHVIEWRRKTSPSYQINGEKFDRLGRSKAPEELLNVLRLPRVEVGDDQLFDVHFGEQKSPIFLLDRASSHAAKFFASSSDVDRFLKMQDRHRVKVADANREKQRLELESSSLNRELELLEPLVELDKRLEKSEKEFGTLESLAQSIDDLTVELAELDRLTTTVHRCATRLAVVAELSSPPALEATEPFAGLIAETERVQMQMAFAFQHAETLRNLHAPPQLASTDELNALVDDLLFAQREFAQRRYFAAALGPLSPPPPLDDADSLARLQQELIYGERLVARWGKQIALLVDAHVPPHLGDENAFRDLLGQLVAAARQCNHVSQVTGVLGDVPPPPPAQDLGLGFELLESLAAADAHVLRCRNALRLLSAVSTVPHQDNLGELGELVQRLMEGTGEVRDCAELSARAENDFRHAKEDLIRWTRANGICPTCGGPIEAERLWAHLSCAGDTTHVSS
jgi:exonuclease SbcC